LLILAALSVMSLTTYDELSLISYPRQSFFKTRCLSVLLFVASEAHERKTQKHNRQCRYWWIYEQLVLYCDGI